MLAKTLGWPTPLPLLAGELFARRVWGGPAAAAGRGRLDEARGAELRPGGARRPRLGAGPVAPCGPARYAAPKLRAKGKTGAIEALLADDAVSAAAPIEGLSDRAEAAAVRPPGRPQRRARAHRPRGLPSLRALSYGAEVQP